MKTTIKNLGTVEKGGMMTVEIPIGQKELTKQENKECDLIPATKSQSESSDLLSKIKSL